MSIVVAALAPSRSSRPAIERRVSRVVAATVAAAWTLLVLAELTGVNHHAGHDAILEGPMPPAVGLAVFLAGWLLMVAAMMLPAAHDGVMALSGRPALRFLGGFAVVWARAGVAALALDTIVHQAAAGIPAIGSGPALVGAALFALAGTIQLTLATRPDPSEPSAAPTTAVTDEAKPWAFRAGREQGVRSLRADGPLMLVMFGLGMNVTAMAVLSVVMCAQRSPRCARPVAVGAGLLLLVGSVLIAADPRWLPSLFGAR